MMKRNMKRKFFRIRHRTGSHFISRPEGAGFSIDPGVVVFSHEAVASHRETFDEAIFIHCVQCVLRAAWDKMASGAVGRGDDLLMKADGSYPDSCC